MVIAADGKFDVDDNALYRQKDLLKYREVSEVDPIESFAADRGVAYVRLDGDIGVIGNGAGLVMTTLDILTRNGGEPGQLLRPGWRRQGGDCAPGPRDRADEPQGEGSSLQHLRGDRAGR